MNAPRRMKIITARLYRAACLWVIAYGLFAVVDDHIDGAAQALAQALRWAASLWFCFAIVADLDKTVTLTESETP